MNVCEHCICYDTVTSRCSYMHRNTCLYCIPYLDISRQSMKKENKTTMKPEKICANCVHCTRENYCLHRQGPYKTWDENHCNNFESKEKDNEIMNEELRKKYGNMTIDDMIEKMEEQKMIIDKKDERINELRDNLVYMDGRIKGCEKQVADTANTLLYKDNRIKDLEDRLAVANRSITSYHSEIKKTREKDAELVKSVEEKDEHIEKLKNELDEANAEIGELGGRITERHATNRDLAKNCVRLETENREKEAKIASLTQELADKKNQIWCFCAKDLELECKLNELQKDKERLENELSISRDANETIKKKNIDLNRRNDELLNNLGEASKEVEEKRTLIIKLENERREKECEIDNLKQQLADKDDVIEDLEERLEHQKHIISNYERDIVRYSKSDEEKKYIENDIALSKAFYEIGEHVSLGFIDAIKAYGKKCEEEAKPKLSYKCCPEIKKLIDDAGYMRDYMERIIRGDKPYNLDISSLYPNKFDLNPNADCPAYAARMKAKYDSLIKVGFTEDQAMSLIPMWTDECGE